MRIRLFVTELMSVGAVDKGDNPDADILFYKRHPAGGDDVTPDRGDQPSEEGRMDFDLSALADDVREAVAKHVADLEERVAALEAENAELAAPEPDDGDDGDVLKNAPDEIRELVAKAEADKAEAEAALAAELEKRAIDEAVGKAAEYEKLLGKADDVGPLLRKVEDALGDDWPLMEQWLRAAAQRIEMGDPTVEVGKRTDPAPGVPLEKRDAWVRDQVDKNPDANIKELRKRFWELHPDDRVRAREVN
jgi:hypothetical protein